MNDYFFPLIKLISLLAMMIYFITGGQGSASEIGMKLFGLSCLIGFSLLFELADRKRPVFLAAEWGLLLFLLHTFDRFCFLLIPVIVLDTLVFFSVPLFMWGLLLAGVFFVPEAPLVYIMYCLFTSILYYQNHIIIRDYKKLFNEFEQKEDNLKRSLTHKDRILRSELEQNALHFENQMLAEKARLSQSLHDKLGHTVNGSIYQLEASKLLIDQDPEESRNRIGLVIHTLRESMDEIRALLRKEKPDKKHMALLQLQTLCESCQKKYDMSAELVMEDAVSMHPAQIDESVWEVILDNAFEAVSNALKHARCKSIRIHITVHNQMIRCHITDDGVGCENIREGMGIQGMRQRTRAIGGSLSVDSCPGFSINMILPLHVK